MKRAKLAIVTMLAILGLAILPAVSACSDPVTEEHYTVTLEYDAAQGTVEKSASQSDEGYVKDEKVTLTVTPNSGFTVDSVKAGSNALTAGNDGKYSFNVTGNTTVTVTFVPEEEVYYFNVNLNYSCSDQGAEYDESMGSAVITPEKEEYAAGEKITLKVTPGMGYEIAFVTVNGETVYVVDGTTDTFSIEVIEDLEIVVTFKTRTAIEIDEVWVGEWKFLDGSMKLSLNETGGTVTINGTPAEIVSAVSTLDTLTLNTAEASYEFYWYQGLVEKKIMTYPKEDATRLLIPDGPITVSDDLDGHWYNYEASGYEDETEDDFTIDAKSGNATFNGEPAFIVACGYFDTITNNDGSAVDVKHDAYYLVVNDDLVYFIAWYRYDGDADQANGRKFDDPALIGGEYAFQTFIHEIYIDPDLQGTWRNFSTPEVKIEITATSVKVDGKEVSVFNSGGRRGQGNYIRIDGVKYSLNADPGYNYYLTREKLADLGFGIRDYFLKGDHELQKISEETTLLGTEWKSLLGTNTVTIDAQGMLKLNNKEYPNIYVCEKLDNGFYKIIAFSVDNYKLEISYKPGEPTIEASDGVTVEQYAKKLEEGSGPVAGFLGLATGTYKSVDTTLTVKIEADKMTVDVSSSYFDDDPIVITKDMLTSTDPLYGSSEQYQFAWHDKTNDKEHTCKIYLNVTSFYMDPKAGELLITLSDYEEFLFDLPTPGTGGSTEAKGFLGLPIGIMKNAEGKEVEIKTDRMIIKSRTFDWFDDPDIEITKENLKAITPIDYYGTSEGYEFTFDSETSGAPKTINIYLNGSISGESFLLCIGEGMSDYCFN